MGALDGIKVIDMGLLVQGPQAALLLLEMGAEVIKVELPGIGDQSRWVLTPGLSIAPYWVGVNRGKRSITIDLRKPEGRDVALRLIDTADVVISNFKPGTLDDWGLGFDVLSARNPRLIFAAGSTYGALGADATLEGADLAGQAAGGIIATTGVDGGPPTPVGVTVADHIASQHLGAGILAALFHRERTGVGQKVETSLVGSAIWAQAAEMSAYLQGGVVAGRANQGHPLINGLYGILPTADGWVALVGVPAPARPGFAAAIGLPGLFENPEYAPPLIPVEVKKRLFADLARPFASKTTNEWVAELRSIGVRCAPVRDYAAIAADPQVLVNGYVRDLDHPSTGLVRVVGSPIAMSATPTTPHAYAPELGEHTEEVLLELGVDWEQIAALRDMGAV